MDSDSNSLYANSSIIYTKMPIGTVIRTHVVDTDPPKTKIFVIVGYYEENVVTIYFNSEINHFINYSQELKNLHIHFYRENRTYLTKDCYCDCSFISIKNKDDLHEAIKSDSTICRGNLSSEDLDKVMITLKNSPKIKGTYKNRYGFYEYQTKTI
jgi:hypothetical protein